MQLKLASPSACPCHLEHGMARTGGVAGQHEQLTNAASKTFASKLLNEGCNSLRILQLAGSTFSPGPVGEGQHVHACATHAAPARISSTCPADALIAPGLLCLEVSSSKACSKLLGAHGGPHAYSPSAPSVGHRFSFGSYVTNQAPVSHYSCCRPHSVAERGGPLAAASARAGEGMLLVSACKPVACTSRSLNYKR